MSELPEYSRLEAAKTAAEKRGLVIIEPRGNELFIDIDDKAGLDWFTENIPYVQETMPCTHERRPSPSGAENRYHITVTFSDWQNRDVDGNLVGDPVPVRLTSYERIMLQALLGSDLKREVLSWQRAKSGQEKPTLFFEKPHDMHTMGAQEVEL